MNDWMKTKKGKVFVKLYWEVLLREMRFRSEGLNENENEEYLLKRIGKYYYEKWGLEVKDWIKTKMKCIC